MKILVIIALLLPHAAEASQTNWESGIIVKEVGETSSYPASTQGGTILVDARSRIELSFDSKSLAPSDRANQWEELQALLSEVKELSLQRVEVVKELQAAKSVGQQQIKESRRLAAAYTRKYSEFLERTRKIMGEAAYNEIDSRAINEGLGFLETLSATLSERLASLTPTSSSISRSTATVEVLAFLEAAGQDRKPLHVDNYDLLPEGILRPLPKTGLEMSTEEQAKLNQELAYARQAVDSIQEIKREKDHLIQQTLAFKSQLREQIVRNLTDGTIGIESARTQLEELRAAASLNKTSPESFPHISSAATTLAAINNALSSLRKNVDSLDAAGPNLLLMGEQTSAIAKNLNGLVRLLPQFRTQVDSAVSEIKNAAKVLAEEQRSAIDTQAKALLQLTKGETQRFFSESAQTLPATAQLANSWQTLWKGAAEQARAAETFGDPQVPTIAHSLDNLPPANVDLNRSGVKVGDYVTIKVRISGKETREKIFRFKVGSMGLHREFTGQLLFAAPSAGPGKGVFEANVGVLATWKYGFRDPKTRTQKFFDWADIGVGMHTTSLHQGGSTMEVGVGGAVSLWGDLLTGGYGWNLGVNKNRGYYFVGIGILDLLHKLNRTTTK